MNYIYDILINFQPNLYDIYDWNIDDVIIHIRKMPLFRIKKEAMLDILGNKIRIEEEFLSKLYNRTEVFTNKKIGLIDYACIVSDGNEALALQFNRKGNTINKSRLLIDECEEVIEYCMSVIENNFKYSLIQPDKLLFFKTRKEEKIYKYITQELSNILKNEENAKLEYLYFECFGKKEKSKDKIFTNIKNELEKNWDNCYSKIYDFFKITTSK